MVQIVLALVVVSVIFTYYMMVTRNKHEAMNNWKRTWERRRGNTRSRPVRKDDSDE